eukprot:TRINITY_DN32951_c0_g1_i2.p1 TRINITY_DN32951_c0_g1~~TRINITY_DN32951_c0_g1_i2.p1  ORF type:complete len:1274 (+),score=287.99 TRINITY_DN32951_c0_g1_i2:42-3863(+)
MQVQFQVRCDATRPGESVFAVGSAVELGAWDPKKGLQLKTDATCFPIWHSEVTLPSDTYAQYRFAIQRDGLQGEARWEDAKFNRKLSPAPADPGQVLRIQTAWNDAKLQALHIDPARELAAENQKKQEELLKKKQQEELIKKKEQEELLEKQRQERRLRGISPHLLRKLERWNFGFVLQVTCDETGLGEVLCAVGSSEEFGGWDPRKAVRLQTDSARFPVWHADLALPSGSKSFDYKLVIVREDSFEEVKQDNVGVRRFESAEPGSVIKVQSKWSRAEDKCELEQDFPVDLLGSSWSEPEPDAHPAYPALQEVLQKAPLTRQDEPEKKQEVAKEQSKHPPEISPDLPRISPQLLKKIEKWNFGLSLRVTCPETGLGECLFAVGSSAEFGGWDEKRALQLQTDKASFPIWYADVALPPGSKSFDYKLVIAREGCAEDFKHDNVGVRRIEAAEPGSVVTVFSKWGSPVQTCAVQKDFPVNLLGSSWRKSEPETPSASREDRHPLQDAEAKELERDTRWQEAEKELERVKERERQRKEQEAQMGVSRRLLKKMSKDTTKIGIILRMECSDTGMGQSLFAVGSPEEFGGWNVKSSVKLQTSNATFPMWSAEIAVPSGRYYDFKLAIMGTDHDCSEDATQEHVNRRIEPAEPGSVVIVKGKWCQEKQTCELQGVSSALLAEAAESDESDLELDADTLRTRNMLWVKRAWAKQEDRWKKALNLSPLAVSGSEEQRARMREKFAKRIPSYFSQHLDVPVVIVSSELEPWSKTGGLAVVAASFAYEFAARGHRTMVVTPMYDGYQNAKYLASTDVTCDGREHRVDYYHEYIDHGGFGTDYVFVNHVSYMRPEGMYCNDETGVEHQDNLFRFALLSLAALEAPFIDAQSMPAYGQRVTFLANDWQTALVPFFLCHSYRPKEIYREARCLFVAHNVGYQGIYSAIQFPPSTMFGLDSRAARDIVVGDLLNLTKAGLICSDFVVTVSPTYASEIMTDEGGLNMQEFVRQKQRARRFIGILNGIDDRWDPCIDPYIALNYSKDNFVKGKQVCKADLQKTLGLQEDPTLPVVGFVGRLTRQKGVDVIGTMVQMMKGGGKGGGGGETGRMQLIMMGSGDKSYEKLMKQAELDHPGLVCGFVGFSDKLEHQMMAGCDFLLMPSRYEPCGLPQMYSQLYGTLPIVTETGGLKDSVKSIEDVGLANATGFKFQPLTADRIKQELSKALEMFYRKRQEFAQMQRNAMRSDFYWPQVIDEYEQVIDQALTLDAHYQLEVISRPDLAYLRKRH